MILLENRLDACVEKIEVKIVRQFLILFCKDLKV